MTFLSKITAPWAVLMGVTAGLNLAIGHYLSGALLILSALAVSYCASKSCWIEGHTAATKAATTDLKKLLDKLDEERKQQPSEDWWKEGQ